MITNPILPGFNPDPCIIRVKNDYYIATSTFEWFPAIAIYHSKDLKNWRLLTHVIDKEESLDLRLLESAKGVWAPDLFFDEGRKKFMVTFTRMANMRGGYFDMDNYLVESENILGPWSKPIYLNSVGFDPSMFKDDDGKYYITSLEWEFREGYEKPGTIVLQEYDIKNEKTIGYAKTISNGATDRGCVEAPRIYKRKGFYYLMLAEGGTGYGHCVTLSRSKNIWGPYETRSQDPIVTSHIENFNERNIAGSKKIEKYRANGTRLQKSGHGSICETKRGEWYLCHLCSRPFIPELCSTLGRETAIEKMRWTEDNWLEMADGTNLAKDSVEESGLAEVKFKKESGRVTFSPWPEYLISPRIERSSWCKVGEKGEAILRGQQSLTSLDRVSLVARQIRSVNCSISTTMDFSPERFQQASGIVIYYDNMNYLSLCKSIEKEDEILCIIQMDNGLRKECFKKVLTFRGLIDLKGTIKGREIKFSFKNNKDYNWIEIDKTFLTTKYSDEYSEYGEFTGTFCGIFTVDGNKRSKEGTFSYFEYLDKLPSNVE